VNAPEPLTERLDLPALALALLAVDPCHLGGVVVRAGPGPETDAWLMALRRSLPAGTPWRRLPVSIDDDRLLGGLDMAASLSAGRPLLAKGLLAEVDDGVLVLPMAERLPRGTAARLAAVIDRGAVHLERDGMARTLPTRFCLVALDESRDDEDPLAPDLSDRLALRLSGADFEASGGLVAPLHAARLIEARARLDDVRCGAAQLEALCGTALALGIDSVRPNWFALRVAVASAALEGRSEVDDRDLAVALRLVLAPRATRLPELPEEQPPPEEEASPPEAEEAQDDAASPETALPAELVLEAIQATLPPGLIASLTHAAARNQIRARVARGGPPARALRRGRPIGVMRGDPRKGFRLALPATLKAAAPWQTLRRRESPEPRRDTLQVRADDFCVVRYKTKRQTTRIFVVDASGSAAAQRLAETKGAVELLLAESYATRDQVALISFRGDGAELLLPPTRALARAKRELAGLPGGGGTPLAAGLHAARELAADLERKGQHPVIILMTDGRANVSLDGSTGHGAAGEEALTAARLLGARQWDALVVDTSRRPRPKARALAEAMDAHYLPLPQANAGGLSKAAAAMASEP
jgi:magnesium chelatase subunit D